MSKFYAIRYGRKTGIFTSWKQTESLVKGFKNAKFKSFKNLDDAKSYLHNNITLIKNIDDAENYLIPNFNLIIQDENNKSSEQ